MSGLQGSVKRKVDLGCERRGERRRGVRGPANTATTPRPDRPTAIKRVVLPPKGDVGVVSDSQSSRGLWLVCRMTRVALWYLRA